MDTLPVSPVAVHLGIAALAAVLYALLPPLGGVVALASLLLPMAFLHVGLAGVYAVMALLMFPCLVKHEGVLVLALIPLALAYPAFAQLLPLVPVLAGLLSGRFLGPYTAFVAALALVVLSLVAGRASVGGVTIGGDQGPLMASENMVFIAEEVKLMPSFEDPRFAEMSREAFRDGNVGHILAWFYMMMHWWGPVCMVGPALTFLELGPRLLAPHMVGLVVMWGVMAGKVSWGVWVIGKKLSTSWMLKTTSVVITGTTLTLAAAVGHLLLSGFVNSEIPALGSVLASAVISTSAAAVLSLASLTRVQPTQSAV